MNPGLSLAPAAWALRSPGVCSPGLRTALGRQPRPPALAPLQPVSRGGTEASPPRLVPLLGTAPAERTFSRRGPSGLCGCVTAPFQWPWERPSPGPPTPWQEPGLSSAAPLRGVWALGDAGVPHGWVPIDRSLPPRPQSGPLRHRYVAPGCSVGSGKSRSPWTDPASACGSSERAGWTPAGASRFFAALQMRSRTVRVNCEEMPRRGV